MSARLNINISGVRRWLRVEEDYWKASRRKILATIAEQGLVILKNEVPKRTGALADSCFSEVRKNTVYLGASAPHAAVVDGEGKTASSPGRYVPAINKRLVKPSVKNPNIGIHPGSRRTPYSKRAADKIRSLAAELLQDSTRGAP